VETLGYLDEMQAIAAEAAVLAGEAGRRAAAALRLRQATGDFDVESVRSRLAALLECDGATGARVTS